VAAEASEAIPSHRGPHAARRATDSVTACSEQRAGASLSTSDDLSSSAASTSRIPPDCPGIRGAPYELPDNFVFDRGWPRSLGVDEERIDLEIERFQANGALSASWQITWRNWWLSPYLGIPIRDQARVLKELRCRAGGVENADCFWLVRHHYGESRVGLVKIALDAYGPDETLDRTSRAIETGDDIGNALWVPDHLRG
jgi:hypothetical protein